MYILYHLNVVFNYFNNYVGDGNKMSHQYNLIDLLKNPITFTYAVITMPQTVLMKTLFFTFTFLVFFVTLRGMFL